MTALGPYICKDQVELTDSFDILVEASEHEKLYPSTAEDSSLPTRRIQYIFTRMINKMNTLMEISDTQAAAALLGFDIGQCSENFWVYDSNSMANFVFDDMNKSETDDASARSDEEPLSDDDSMHDWLEDDSSHADEEDPHRETSDERKRDATDCPFEDYVGAEAGDGRYGCKRE